MTQDQLIQGLANGDTQAIAWLYDHYGAALFGIILRIVKDQELAENLLQDTFVKIWKAGSTFDAQKAGLFAWMQRIARNTAIDATRSAVFKQRAETTEADNLVYRQEESAFNPDHIGIREILGKLDDKYRILIEKAYFEGYTQQELEEELGIPLGTVKTRMRQAMQMLRQLLSDMAVFVGWILFMNV